MRISSESEKNHPRIGGIDSRIAPNFYLDSPQIYRYEKKTHFPVQSIKKIAIFLPVDNRCIKMCAFRSSTENTVICGKHIVFNSVQCSMTFQKNPKKRTRLWGSKRGILNLSAGHGLTVTGRSGSLRRCFFERVSLDGWLVTIRLCRLWDLWCLHHLSGEILRFSDFIVSLWHSSRNMWILYDFLGYWPVVAHFKAFGGKTL